MELRSLLSLAAPYRKRLVLLGLLMLGSSLAMLAIPWLAGKMLGGILAPDAISQNWLVAALLALLSVLALLNFAVSWISGDWLSRDPPPRRDARPYHPRSHASQ